MKFLIVALLGSLVSAFVPTSQVQRSTKLQESFGFDFAEDTYKNQPDVLGGEATYKQWVNKIEDNSFLNRKVSPFIFYSITIHGFMSTERLTRSLTRTPHFLFFF